MFRFDLTEPVPHEIRRLALGELKDAAESLSGGDEPLAARIHEARKRLKRLRALLDLVEQSAERGARRALIEASRNAAQLLAAPRGHAALLHCYETLVAAQPECENPALRRELAERAASVNAEGDALEAAARILHDARPSAKSLNVAGSEFEVIEAGFRATYRRAQKALARAREHGDAADFHAFRKPCKRHLYQLRLLEGAWPALMQAQALAIDGIGELAGEHHDLCLLSTEVARVLEGDAARDLKRAIARRASELEQQILTQGALGFAEKPRSISARVGGYWRQSAAQR